MPPASSKFRPSRPRCCPTASRRGSRPAAGRRVSISSRCWTRRARIVPHCWSRPPARARHWRDFCRRWWGSSTQPVEQDGRAKQSLVSTGRDVRLRRWPAALYISPLKALAVDIARNLERPIAEMGLLVKVETRTGDTPVSRRRRQRRYPPDILLTAPEQVALLLSSDDAPFLFSSLKRIVLDELHALVTSKRGDLLSLGSGAALAAGAATARDRPVGGRGRAGQACAASWCRSPAGRRAAADICRRRRCRATTGRDAGYPRAPALGRSQRAPRFPKSTS